MSLGLSPKVENGHCVGNSNTDAANEGLENSELATLGEESSVEYPGHCAGYRSSEEEDFSNAWKPPTPRHNEHSNIVKILKTLNTLIITSSKVRQIERGQTGHEAKQSQVLETVPQRGGTPSIFLPLIVWGCMGRFEAI